MSADCPLGAFCAGLNESPSQKEGKSGVTVARYRAEMKPQ